MRPGGPCCFYQKPDLADPSGIVRSIPETGHLGVRHVCQQRANNRLRRRRVKAVRQHNLYNILPFRWMARDMPFPMRILD